MKTRNLFCFGILFFISEIGFTQEKKKFQLYGTPQIQLLNGANSISSSIGLSLGVQKSTLQYGFAIGIDYYQFRTLPITVECKKYFTTKKNKPFVFAGVGYSINWLLENQKKQTNFIWWGGGNNTFADYNNGITYNMGIGYALLNKHNKGILLSVGYNTKKITESYSEGVFNGTTTVQMPRENKYALNRLAIGVAYTL